MKKNIVLSKCPVCSNNLEVKRLECSSCHTSIEGNFVLSKFNYLSSESLYFIEIFVKNRGNIKLIEKELNISYPTVKKMLDEVILGLGYKVTDEEEKEENTSVLDKVKSGELSVDDALKLIKKGWEKNEKKWENENIRNA